MLTGFDLAGRDPPDVTPISTASASTRLTETLDNNGYYVNESDSKTEGNRSRN